MFLGALSGASRMVLTLPLLDRSRYFSSAPGGGGSGGDHSQLGGRLSGSLFTLVTFTAGDGAPDPPVSCCLPVAAPEKLLFYLDNAE